MKLEEAHQRILPYVGLPFREILPQHLLRDLTTNKGNVGQVLEGLIGIRQNTRNLDFDDGELKTNKVERSGKPLETMFITQVSTRVDDCLACKPFQQTHLYEKISNLLYVPVCKQGAEPDWLFLPPIHADLHSPTYRPILEALEADYVSVCRQMNSCVRGGDGNLHTCSGRFMQIRTKDSTPYHPIYSQTCGRYVSNKNFAFYFMKTFMTKLQSTSPDYPFSAARYQRDHSRGSTGDSPVTG